MPYNFTAESIHTKKLCSRLSSRKVHFLYRKRKKSLLRPPLRFSGNVRTLFILCSLERLSISHSWTFFSTCFRFVTIYAFDRRTDGQTDRQTSTAIPCVYASHSRTVKTWQLRMHCNLRQLDAAQSLSALISSPVPSSKSLSLSGAVLERFYCLYVTLRCDLEF